MTFEFEGDFENLNDSQIKLIENVLLKQGFKDGKVIVNPVGQKGDNYVANIKRFTYEKSDGSFFKMIGKVAPVAHELRLTMNTEMLFTNEIIMYEEVIPKFKELQDKSGAVANERIRFPECYGIVKEVPYELILLEDLGESDFEMLDRFQPLNDNTVRLMLKDLATFHSLSYALKNKEPETYNNFANRLRNMWVVLDLNPGTKLFFEATENDLKALMDSEKCKNALSGSISKCSENARQLRSYEKGNKYSVIQQGDCWSNNILFKLENGKAIENVMIDYQLSRESNPAADVLYFILNCTDYETRTEHYNEWIDFYHEMLSDALTNHGLSADHVFPKDQFDADLKRYGKLLVGLGMFLASMLIRESKDVIDIKDMPNVHTDEMLDTVMSQVRTGNLDNSTIGKLKLRIEGIINSAMEFELI